MRITLKSTGGFTGPAGSTTVELDSDTLGEGEAERLQKLAAALSSANVPNLNVKKAPASWDFMHEMTVETDGQVRLYRYHEDAAPAPLLALHRAVADREFLRLP